MHALPCLFVYGGGGGGRPAERVCGVRHQMPHDVFSVHDRSRGQLNWVRHYLAHDGVKEFLRSLSFCCVLFLYDLKDQCVPLYSDSSRSIKPSQVSKEAHCFITRLIVHIAMLSW